MSDMYTGFFFINQEKRKINRFVLSADVQFIVFQITAFYQQP
ncbi:MAG: hypothetical protein JWN76_2482 [Chitinophagaceae bacterium]|nr:hypothetical protein [Chitinophagaceae bacterium]